MKTRISLSFVFFLLSFVLSAQVPHSFTYQAVVRNNGEIVKNATLDVRLSLLQGAANGSVVWTETQSVTTGDFGLFTLQAGSVTPLDIDWSAGPYFLKVETDLKNGSGFREMGRIQLLSVPYALYAGEVADKDDADADTTNEIQDLRLNGNLLTITRNESATSIDLSAYLDNPGWHRNGDTLSFPGSVAVGTDTAGGSRLAVQGDDTGSEKPLFEVKRKDGQPVFAVYNEGVRVYVDTATSWSPCRSGFTVGGFGMPWNRDYFHVSGSPGIRMLNGENGMMWYPEKNALLAGHLVVENGDSVGANSISMGYNAKSYGDFSTAIGADVIARGNGSVALGRHNITNGYISTSMGYKNIASGDYSMAGGIQSAAAGYNALAVGNTVKALGDFSTATGNNTTAWSYNSFVAGSYNSYSTSSDKHSWVGSDPLFVIGNGTYYSRHNAMVVKKNGAVYFPDVYYDVVGVNYRDLYIDNTGRIGYLSSSRRYKKNIRSLDSADWIYRLRPVSFTYKSDRSGMIQNGLIAEEVEKVNPLIVSYNEEGKAETVQYSKLIIPMLKALQEQRETIEEQQKTIDALKEEVSRLKNEQRDIAAMKKPQTLTH